MEKRASDSWKPELYQASHSFVWEFGRDLLALLEPRPGERILDLGCGTGQLTAEIVRSGAEVLGVDSSEAMIAQARANFPELRFEVAQATALPYREEFDAVFSNATLHWVRDAEAAAGSIVRALKPGGRFVAEFGGRGNASTLLETIYNALHSLGVADAERLNPWFFPSVAEYATILERSGLAVNYAVLFDRPTPLENGSQGLANWLAMFGECFMGVVAPDRRHEFVARVEQLAATRLLHDGVWTVDYRRLRIAARKP